jgi:hypothetical protein
MRWPKSYLKLSLMPPKLSALRQRFQRCCFLTPRAKFEFT